MKPITINIIIFILTTISAPLYYNKYDKNYYKCSKFTHIMALSFSFTNMLFILLIQKKLDSKILLASHLLLALSSNLLLFHILYHVNK